MPAWVTFVCRTCEDYNKQNLGTPGFVERQTRFDSLTDAWDHLNESMSNPDQWVHHIDAIVEFEIGNR